MVLFTHLFISSLAVVPLLLVTLVRRIPSRRFCSCRDCATLKATPRGSAPTALAMPTEWASLISAALVPPSVVDSHLSALPVILFCVERQNNVFLCRETHVLAFGLAKIPAFHNMKVYLTFSAVLSSISDENEISVISAIVSSPSALGSVSGSGSSARAVAAVPEVSLSPRPETAAPASLSSAVVTSWEQIPLSVRGDSCSVPPPPAKYTKSRKDLLLLN